MDCTHRDWLFLGLEVEVESVSEPVELDLSGGEEPVGGGDHSGERPGGGGEVSPCQMTSQVPSLEGGDLVRGVVGVDEGRFWLDVLIVLVVVLLGGSVAVHSGGPGRVLTSAGDVVSPEDPEPVHACAVLHGDLLPIGGGVAVLPDPLVVPLALLPVHHPVLLGEGRAEGPLASIEPGDDQT